MICVLLRKLTLTIKWAIESKNYSRKTTTSPDTRNLITMSFSSKSTWLFTISHLMTYFPTVSGNQTIFISTNCRVSFSICNYCLHFKCPQHERGYKWSESYCHILFGTEREFSSSSLNVIANINVSIKASDKRTGGLQAPSYRNMDLPPCVRLQNGFNAKESFGPAVTH